MLYRTFIFTLLINWVPVDQLIYTNKLSQSSSSSSGWLSSFSSSIVIQNSKLRHVDESLSLKLLWLINVQVVLWLIVAENNHTSFKQQNAEQTFVYHFSNTTTSIFPLQSFFIHSIFHHLVHFWYLISLFHQSFINKSRGGAVNKLTQLLKLDNNLLKFGKKIFVTIDTLLKSRVC